MFLRRFLSTNRDDKADRSSLGKDRTSTTPPTLDLPGRDSVKLPEHSPTTDTLGVADASQVATPNYSKRSSGKLNFPSLFSFSVNFVSILQDICRGRSHSLEDTRSR